MVEQLLRFGEISIAPDRRQVLRNGQPIKLGGRAFDLLMVLVENRGRVVTKDELLDRVWGDESVEEGNIQVHVSNLRAQLGRSSIATIPGRGYRFVLGETLGPTSLDVWADSAGAVERPELIGRQRELEVLCELVCNGPLATVVGTGGIGKTALVRALIRSRLLPPGLSVSWVDVVLGMAVPDLRAAVARAAGLEVEADDGGGSLAEAMQGRAVLVVLDNCEAATEACAEVVGSLLEHIWPSRIIATTQEPLQIAGERVLRLGPLAVPSAGAAFESADDFPAVRLFMRTLAALDHRFRPTSQALQSMAAVCRRLDGNPLAIELGAARVPLLGLAELERRISEQLDLLRTTRRDLPERQRSLRAVAEWSVALLSESSAKLLRSLSVFEEGFGLDAATAVGAVDDMDRFDILEHLQNLVNRSLLHVDDAPRPQYRLLDSTRALAAEQAVTTGCRDAAWTRKAEYMRDLALRGLEDFWVQPEDEWVAAYRGSHRDFLEVFGEACRLHLPAIAAPIGLLLCRLDDTTGVFSGVAARKLALWSLLRDADPLAVSMIWRALSWHGVVRIGELSALEVAQCSADAARATADPRSLHGALCRLAMEAAFAGQAELASSALDEARQLEDPGWPPRIRFVRALAGLQFGRFASNFELALRCGQEAIDLARESRSRPLVVRCSTTFADAVFDTGDCDRALELWLRVLPELRALGRPAILATTLADVARASLLVGRIEQAQVFATEALPLIWRHPWFPVLVNCIAYLGAKVGEHAAAAKLLGYAARCERGSPGRLETGERQIIDGARKLVELGIATDQLQQLMDEGRCLEASEVMDLCTVVLA
jgi:predicted ATPase